MAFFSKSGWRSISQVAPSTKSSNVYVSVLNAILWGVRSHMRIVRIVREEKREKVPKAIRKQRALEDERTREN